MALEFKKAVRNSVPMLISIGGTSGAGKTYSALLLAAGIAGPTGRVGFIDTENGRGSMYADSPGIAAALPNGYEILRLDPQFTPERYIEAIKAAEGAGINVLVIDSATHEWEGIGGCCDIAENNKLKGMPNWSKAKMAHKRFVNHCLSSSMHIIFCLRAREKVKIVKRGDPVIDAAFGVDNPERYEKDSVIPIGLQPIAEKSFVFEMLLSLLLDEKSHSAMAVKVPEPLAHLFPGTKLLTKADGERIRQWNDTGAVQEEPIQLLKRARTAAEDGIEAYKAFFAELTAAQRKAIGNAAHAENKAIAEQTSAVPVFGSEHNPVDWPEGFEGPALIWNGQRYGYSEESSGYAKVTA